MFNFIWTITSPLLLEVPKSSFFRYKIATILIAVQGIFNG